MFIEDIKTASPFRELFPIQEQVLDRIIWDMRKNGYDQDKPIVLWEGHNVVVDGHTRLRAARKAGLFQIPVISRKFSDEAAALQYAVDWQRNRRNLRDADILSCISKMDVHKPAGRRRSNGKNYSGNSAKITAEILGISSRKVQRARTVIDRASENIIKTVLAGKMSIYRACERTVKPEILPLSRIDEAFNRITSKLNREEISELITRLQEYLIAL
jgi:ParB family chromosome partitioning protein